jgi:HEAT repeat protein
MHALKAIGTPRALEALRDLVNDSDPVVAEAAREIMKK